MTATELRPAVAIPAGWYPDPVDAVGLRWWSGETWTEHVTEPQPQVAPAISTHPVASPALPAPLVFGDSTAEPAIPDVTRFSRDPLVSGRASSVTAATMGALQRKDPYRERNVLSGVALVVALLGLFAIVARLLFDLPDIVWYLLGGVPFSIATLAVVVAIRTSRGLAVAVIAAALCLVNVAMVAALSAAEAREDIAAALESQQNQPTFEQAVEDSVVQTTNTLDMPALAIFADCPDIPLPEIGTIFDCTVTLENGDSHLVHVTSKDGLGAMAMELIDEPIAPGTEPSAG